MWISELRQALVRGEQRVQPWPSPDRVLDEATYRRIVTEAIDAEVSAIHDASSDRAYPSITPDELRRNLVQTWLLESTGRDWVGYVDRRLRDLDQLAPADVSRWTETLLRAGVAHRRFGAESTEAALVAESIDVNSAPRLSQPDAVSYLHAIQLLRDGMTTSLGRVLLRLQRREATRWLLVVELLQSTGPADPHRLSRATAEMLLERPERTVYDSAHDDPDEIDFPHAWSTLRRLESLNLVWLDPDDDVMRYKLWPEGAAILQEVISADLPMRAVAGALLAQDAVSLISDRRYRTSADRRAADWVVETMAHGLRNALGPVSFALDEISATTPELGRLPAFARVGTGLSRSLKLIDDLVTLYNGARSDAEPFDLGAALRDVVATANGSGVALDTRATDGVRLLGQRLRFVHALVDMIRNARRHARPGQPLEVRISTEREPRAIRILVDDNGSGVPPDLRGRVFDPGFSTHPEGTGQGLSLLTEVVRGDYDGSIVVQDSPLGGARFVLTIPLDRES